LKPARRTCVFGLNFGRETGGISKHISHSLGQKLAGDVAAVMKRHPDADPEDVRLTLISLQSPPLERLNRSLRRGRGFAAFRK
jgi:hypothetical protein